LCIFSDSKEQAQAIPPTANPTLPLQQPISLPTPNSGKFILSFSRVALRYLFFVLFFAFFVLIL
jgi:hypothetical protein